MGMSEKHKLAGSKRWAGVPVEERSKMMSELAKKRQSSMTYAEKVKHAKLMVKARIKNPITKK